MHKTWIKHRKNCFKKRHELYKNQGQKKGDGRTITQ